MKGLNEEWKKLAWVLLVGCGVAVRGGTVEGCMYKHRAQVVALLALHSGPQCQHVLERGLQQQAALHFTNNQVNSANPHRPHIEAIVYDTCSTSEQAVNAVLQTLVRAKQGCKGPMFLGFIGPDDNEGIQAVAKVISMFEYPHVTLQAVRSYSQYNTFEIETVDTSVTANGISLFLDEMNWASFYMAFTTDEISSRTASRLLESSKYCLLQTSTHIPTTKDPHYVTAYHRLLNAMRKGENNRLLVIAEKPESAETLISHLESVTNKTKIVVYLRSTGILPWRLSTQLCRNIVILQETSKSSVLPESFREEIQKSPLWEQFTNETNCDTECEDKLIRDASTTNVAYAVHLFHEALHSGIVAKCSTPDVICPVMVGKFSRDWRGHVEKQVSHYMVPETDDVHKMKFHSLIDRQVAILAADAENDFQLMGEISNGESLLLNKRQSLPTTQMSREEQCAGNLPPLATLPPQTSKNSTTDVRSTGFPIVVDVFGMDVKLGDFGYYELVAILAGSAFGLVALFMLITYFVYRCFRVNTNKTFSSPSTTSRATPKRNNTKFVRSRLRRNSSRSEHTVIE